MSQRHQLEELKWFKRNVELQLEDIEFEKKGNTIALYFDTADVQRAVLGLKAYYDPHSTLDPPELKQNLFASDKALVDCLIAGGLLGPFQMVPPHLSEFAHKVENRFDLPQSRSWDEEAKRFLANVGLIKSDTPIEDLTEVQVRELTAREIEKAPLWFKGINCVLPWHRRLNIWLNLGLLTLDAGSLPSRTLVSRPEFPVLKDLFDVKRKGVSVNNFVDALAVSYLIVLTTRFAEGQSDIVPRFFLPPDEHTFKPVIDEAGLDSKLSCHHPTTGKASTIFRDADYYKFRVTFRPSARFLISGPTSTPEAQEANLRKLCEIVTNSIEYTRDLSEEEARQYAHNLNDVYDGKSLAELIKDLRSVTFIKANRFKTVMDKDFLDVINQMKEVQQIVARQKDFHDDNRVQENVLREFNKRNRDLDERLNEYRWFSLMWEAVFSRGTQTLTKRLQNFDEDDREDYFREFGLLRYGFPQERHRQISKILRHLSSQSNDQILKGSAETLKAYVNGRKNQSGDEQHLIVATAILIAERLDPQLLELLEEKENRLSHFSLRIAFGELLFRTGERGTDTNRTGERASDISRIEKANKVLDGLRKEFKEKQDGIEKSHLAVGIAYLSYRAWRASRELMDRDGKTSEDFMHEANTQIQRARRYADYAYKTFTEREASTKAYALNQYLFYSIESGEPISLDEWEPTVTALKNYKMKRHVWQFRFDDTLARYYEKVADTISDPKFRKVFLDLAFEYSKFAHEKSDDDKDVSNLYFHLKAKAASFSMKYGKELESVN